MGRVEGKRRQIDMFGKGIDELHFRVRRDDFRVLGLRVLFPKPFEAEVAVSSKAPDDVKFRGLGHEIAINPGKEIIECRRGAEILRVISLGGRKHVADVFGGVNPRHRVDDDPAHEEIRPVFPMVFVAPCVVLADVGEAVVCLPFLIHRRMVPVVVFGGVEKLGWAHFRKVMLQTMKENAAMETVSYHLVAVFGDSSQMRKPFNHHSIPLPREYRGVCASNHRG